MMPAKKPIRSYLFVPANRPERFPKAEASGADAVILDLEDSVPDQDKTTAREAVVNWMRERPDAGVSVWIRINSLRSQWIAEDLQAVMQAKPDGVFLPKCEGIDDVLALDGMLSRAESGHGLPDRGIAIIAIVTETPRALQKLHTFAQPAPRLHGMLWGAEDLAAALGLRSLRDKSGAYLAPAMDARNRALMASHACQAIAIDAVFTDIHNPAALAHETRQHASLGFAAKAAIHPGQIEVIHQALQPSAEDIDWAKQVIQVLDDGRLASGTVDGSMVDRPHLNAAKQILQAHSSACS